MYCKVNFLHVPKCRKFFTRSKVGTSELETIQKVTCVGLVIYKFIE
jgi:hypothetical protein